MAVFSCIQVRNEPKTRVDVPESPAPPMPEKPFSISSSHRMQGAAASAVLMAVRMFCSLEPTTPAKTLPTSRRSSGSSHPAAIAFAVNDLPQPGTPVIRTPFGARDPVGGGLVEPRVVALRKPPLQVLQAADGIEVNVGVDELEDPGLADRLLLLLGHDVDVVIGKHAIVHHRSRERVRSLVECQSEGGLGKPLTTDVVDLDAQPRIVRGVGVDHLVQDTPDLRLGRKREVQEGDVLLELGRDSQQRSDDDQGARSRTRLECL